MGWEGWACSRRGLRSAGGGRLPASRAPPARPPAHAGPSSFAGSPAGRLLDLLRRIYCFGLSLMKLDLRQESGRHTDALTEVTE